MPTDVFHAIADPTRRSILRMLADRELPVGAVATHFTMSRPAVSKHLRLLRQAGLIETVARGRERYCRLRPERLKEVSEWVEQFDVYWADTLSNLKHHVEKKTR